MTDADMDRRLSCTPWNLAKFYSGLALRLAGVALRRYRGNYIRLRPACSRRQRVRSLRNGQTFEFAIRDLVDYTVFNQVYVNEEYDLSRLPHARALKKYYDHLVGAARTPLVLDCGANIGLAATYFAERFPHAKVVAIEPEKGNCQLARQNCAGRNIEVIEAAIASTESYGAVVDPGLGGWGYRVRATEHNEQGLRMISVERVLAANKRPTYEPFIAKIDIEGFEDDLFSKNTSWIDQFPLLIIELHDWMLPWKSTSRNFLSAIGSLDRDFIYIGENVFSISTRLRDMEPENT